MITTLSIIQIALSITLVVAILLQTSAGGMGALGGGDSVDSGYHTRRGFEKTLFNSTIVLAVLFAVISFIIFFVTR
jgi:preprotein translocase subunit SecG